MLVVTANWCLSDGTLAAAALRWSLRRLWREIGRAACRHGVRSDGRYEPVEAVDVVLAGDTFDWLTSRRWLGSVRPWQQGSRPAAVRAAVVAAALSRSRRLIGGLAARARRGLPVPAADRRGRPLPGVLKKVPVRLAVLGGDRDRGLDRELPPEIVRSVGIAVGTRWCGESGGESGGGTTAVWHGDEFDPFGGEDVSGVTLNDTLAVELLARFAAAVADGPLSPPAAALVTEIVRGHAADAAVAIVRRLDDLDRAGADSVGLRPLITDRWNRAVSEWHRVARRLGVGGGAGRDALDPLADWLTIDRDHGVGRMPPPAARLSAAAEPPVPPAGLVVLGHPPAGLARLRGWRGRVACLGLEDSSADAAGDPRVTAAVVPAGGDASRIEWLPGDVASPTIGGDEFTRRGVWRSEAEPSRPRVLDAA